MLEVFPCVVNEWVSNCLVVTFAYPMYLFLTVQANTPSSTPNNCCLSALSVLLYLLNRFASHVCVSVMAMI